MESFACILFKEQKARGGQYQERDRSAEEPKGPWSVPTSLWSDPVLVPSWGVGSRANRRGNGALAISDALNCGALFSGTTTGSLGRLLLRTFDLLTAPLCLEGAGVG